MRTSDSRPARFQPSSVTKANETARRAAIGLVIASLTMVGCGNDTDGAKAASTTSAVTGSAASAEFRSFCDAVVDADAAVGAAQTQGGPPDEAAVTAARAAMKAVGADAPDEIADAVDQMVAGGTAMLDANDGEPPAGFDTASETTYGWVQDHCGFNSVDVTAKEYEYQGMPGDMAAGKAVVNLTNDGTEFHEMIFVRINDGVTDSTEELMALPEDEVMSKIEMKGTVFAVPGSTTHSTVDLSAGRYIVACFIPVGLTPEAAASAEASGAAPDGPPHFTQGMVHDITVA